MKSALLTTWAWLMASAAMAGSGQPVRLHPDNPHYFLWRDRPTVLVTCTEHYGAVMNLDFDYARYLDELQLHRFNLTRVFSGTYRELPASFNITGNTLAPAPGRYLGPWARNSTPGAADGGNQFDLTQWDEAYFERLKDFIRQAGRRGIVVELVLFCTFYDEPLWQHSPMHPRNNVNDLGTVRREEVYSGKPSKLLALQQAVVRKLVTEMNEFDNLYFEICNEPYERSSLTRSWNDQMIAAIVDAEAALPNRHLVAQGFPPSPAAVADLHARVSILNFHAAAPSPVSVNFRWNRVIAFDETGGADQTDRKYRSEGWLFLLAGGGVYDHLDFSFTPEREDGTAVPLPPRTPGGGGPALRRQLAILKKFIADLDFIHMTPDETTLQSSRITTRPGSADAGAAVPARIQVLSRPGSAYALYVVGGTDAELVLALPPATYRAEWVSPKTGAVQKSEDFAHAGGTRKLLSPVYSEDIALRLRRQPSAEPKP